MTDKSPYYQDRPLISFVVIAYNQEKYIREAIRGAFDQTYEPLEIILSDDDSTDLTFEIMQEMAAAYHGPHETILNRNNKNLGLIDHVNLVHDLSKGSYIVAAAGDDVSLPNRTEVISKEIIQYCPTLIHSNVQPIDDKGKRLSVITYDPTFWRTVDPYASARSVGLYIGATGVWKKGLFRKYGKIKFTNAYEDLVIGYRAALEGNIKFIDEPLVLYRVNTGISHMPDQSSSRAVLKYFSARTKIAQIYSFEQRLVDTENSNHEDKAELLTIIKYQISLYRAKYRLYNSPLEFIIKDLWKPHIILSFSRSLIRVMIRKINL